MSLIKRMRRQRAVYWKRADPNEFGKFAFDDPIEIKCRWESHEGAVRNEKNELIMSKATVYVDREMFLGDRLKLGELESGTPDDPSGDPLAMEIQGFEKLPNLRNRETLYTAHL
jgi:hypothetical protein